MTYRYIIQTFSHVVSWENIQSGFKNIKRKIKVFQRWIDMTRNSLKGRSRQEYIGYTWRLKGFRKSKTNK